MEVEGQKLKFLLLNLKRGRDAQNLLMRTAREWAAFNIATNARKETGKHERFCALISIDIRNTFNTARWNICIEAIVQKKVPDYLLRMIYRWVIYEGD